MPAHSYPSALDELIQSLGSLPGIGRRTAERLALALLEWPQDQLDQLAERVRTLQTRIHYCSICGNFADAETCRICTSPARRKDIVCVVEQPTQIAAIEATGSYDGVYHVLGGRLAPLEGVGPENLRIPHLEERVRNGGVAELILATGSDVEGEATASYVADRLSSLAVEITRIAAGIPVGADLAYADSATMAIALTGRRRLL